MSEFLKSLIGKCFLYTLLCVVVFGFFVLIGAFIAGNFNVFEWQELGRGIICLLAVTITTAIILINEEIV